MSGPGTLSVCAGGMTRKYGATITLWSDELVYAFLRIAADDVVLVIINNGYKKMSHPIRLRLNSSVIPQRVAEIIRNGLTHWKTGRSPVVEEGDLFLALDGKTIDIYC